ncbi:hypothetical protein [Paenibacillus graminis]|uniref:hypothetical protein n=1 Tax=Paenibacillus graminis TaxID=189425 RepID=UPI000471569A|nr:hypothetical protein [Paenibacillus graminis]
MIVFVILGLLAIIFIGAAVYGVKQGIEKSKKLKEEIAETGALQGIYVTHVEGLGIGNVECKIFRFSDRVLIDSSKQKFEIYLDQLRAAEAKSEKELIEKGKSVVGRAVIGTLLVPGLGTIVGGMSGIGNKKKKGKTNHYMIFNFIDSKGELSAVTFQDVISFGINDFCKNINNSPRESNVVRL